MAVSIRSFCAIALLSLLLAVAACRHKTAKDFHGKDRVMVDSAILIRNAIDGFRGDTSDFPDNISQVEKYLPPASGWPTNPYNGQPITDNGSAEFEAAKSVGTIHYEVFYRDEQAVGCRVHVFGDKGKLLILDHTAFGAQ